MATMIAMFILHRPWIWLRGFANAISTSNNSFFPMKSTIFCCIVRGSRPITRPAISLIACPLSNRRLRAWDSAMKLFAESAKRICLTATLVVAVPGVFAKERTFTRHFVASVEERYQVTLNVKAESHSVTTETVAAQTYVTPLLHTAELNLRWRAVRSILAVNDDGSAAIQETLTPARQQCEEVPQHPDKTDPALQLSLKKFCTLWLRMEIIGYTESDRGVLKAASASEDALPPLAETAPQLLSLWLKRAVRPSVILPQLHFEIGATSRRSFHPSANILKNARGSESAEWNDAQGETP